LARGEAQQIGRHPHLPIAVVTGSDADHGQVQLAAQIAGQSLGNVFEHQGEATGVLQLPRLAPQPLLGHGIGGLTAIPQLSHRLGRQAQVTHHGDAVAHQPVNHHEGLGFGPLQLHAMAAGLLQQATGGSHGAVAAALVAEERQVHHQRGVPQGSLHGHGVMDHGIEGHRQGCGMAQGHHAQGITHQHQVHPGGFGPAGTGGIPGGEHGDRQTLAFAAHQQRQQLGGAEGHDVVRPGLLLASQRLGPTRFRRPNLVRTGRQQPHGML